ncbi:MAG: cyclopropane-fatty-acyl-phospholipid synthase family protein [Pseudomonadota bacterium]|nr:cyclopropane-fatty-acyl-phospholipid synthase family protein [Pseudomonadota bacterium]
MLLSSTIHHIVVNGRLDIIDGDGKRTTFGSGASPDFVVRLRGRGAAFRMAANPQLAIGEAYMTGDLTLESGSLYDFLIFMAENLNKSGPSKLMKLREMAGFLTRRFMQRNVGSRSRSNVAHHYDLTEDLYGLFLDEDKQYSCAYFVESTDDLEVAQARKKRHIAAKLCLSPGLRVLDIGSGWGGLALYLAREAAVTVDGLTLSKEQLNVAVSRASKEGMSTKVRFALKDYRDKKGEYDRIVSIGMFEHVGVPFFNSYFQTISDRLAPEGVALVHTIGRTSGPGVTNPFIRKYIFPGGYIPAISEVLPAIEKAGLLVTDIEVLRLHYAETLKAWRDRFLQNWHKVSDLYTEEFCRMWEFYLSASEVAFRAQGLVVWQIQIAKRQDSVPLTRDYITDYDRGGDDH